MLLDPRGQVYLSKDHAVHVVTEESVRGGQLLQGWSLSLGAAASVLIVDS